MSNATLSPSPVASKSKPSGAKLLQLELNAQGAIQAVNAVCSKVTGFSPGELNERPLWSALLIPEEVALFKERLDQLRTEVDSIEFESHVVTKHGERRHMAWSCSAVRDEQRALRAITCQGCDITEPPAGAGECGGSADEVPYVSTPQGMIRERRLRSRTSYPYKQSIAPLTGEELPARSAFRAVQCREIAAGGFSYFAPLPPNYERLVIAFGAAPSIIFLSAKIKHVTPTECEGRLMYHVGCEYIERLAYRQS